MYKPWEQDVIDLRAEGMSWSETAGEISRRYPEMDVGEMKLIRSCRAVMEKYARNNRVSPRMVTVAHAVPDQSGLIDALKKGGALSDIARKMGVSERVAEAMISDAKDGGYNVEQVNGDYKISTIASPQENRIKENWNGDKVIRFGLIGDTHLGCVDVQLTFLHHLYDIFQREGITKVYHTGDLTDGEKMRAGHEYEIYVHGADAQVDHAVKVYPNRPGIVTDFITGNHDYSFIKTIGLDIGKQIASRRQDMNYLGYMSAMIDLSPNCLMELRHPLDGSVYALSYKIQKLIDAMPGGEKPNILAVGHFHKHEWIFYRNVHAFQSATVCGQTFFMRGKGLAAAIGGWIIEAHVDDTGTVTEIAPRFFPLYKAVKEDYKAWL